MKILIDTNVILDLLLEREPFVEMAIALFEQIEQGNLEGYIANLLPHKTLKPALGKFFTQNVQHGSRRANTI